MGGTGSTRWPRDYIRKPRVEECYRLDLGQFIRALDQRDNLPSDGSLIRAWQNHRTEELTFFVRVRPSTTYDGRPALRLEFIDPIDHNLLYQTVPLEQLEVLGSRVKRWYGRCPECLERCAKIYLPPGNDRFGCRHCLDLSYESRQTSHSGVRALRQDPARCLLVMRTRPTTLHGVARFYNAMKAYPYPPRRSKGGGRVPWQKWETYFTLEMFASGELQQLKVEMEEGEGEEEEAA